MRSKPVIRGLISINCRARNGNMDNKLFKVNLIELKKLESTGESVSYKVLCEKIGLNRVEGNQKRKQLKDLQRICSFDKNGSKYVITDVFSDTDEILLEHGNNVFDQYIERILISVFQSKPTPIYVTNSSLITMLFMVNSNFKGIRSDEKLKQEKAHEYHCVVKNLDMAMDVISNNILGRWARTALRRISAKGYFSAIPSYQFSTSYNIEIGHVEKIQFTTHDVAPDGEMYKIIDDSSKAVLAEMGLTSRRMDINKRIAYYRKLSAKVKEVVGDKIENLESVWDCLVLKRTDEQDVVTKIDLSDAIAKVNAEAVKKCAASKQLNFLTGTARVNVVNDLIRNQIGGVYLKADEIE